MGFRRRWLEECNWKGADKNMIELFNLIFVESPTGLSIILIVGIIAIGIEGYRSS